MLESQSRAQKTQILAWFPIQIWVKKLFLVVGALGSMTSAKNAKTYRTYDVIHKKTEI